MREKPLDKSNENEYRFSETIITCFFVWLLIIIFSGGSAITLSQLFNGFFGVLLAPETVQIFAMAVIGIMLLLKISTFKIKSINDFFGFITPFVLTVLAMVSVGLSVDTNVTLNTFFQVSAHVFIIFFIFFYCKQSRARFNVTMVARFVVFIGILEALLGIYQHVLSRPIFDTTNLNSVYFLNGYSSSNVAFLGAGASVRAFGTFDSGLSLGVFLLMCVGITLDFANFKRRTKVIVLIIFLLAIYFTLTRNVYIGLVVFIFYYLLARIGFSKRLLNFSYIMVALVSGMVYWFTNLLNWLISLASQAKITTFGARFMYMKISISRIPDYVHFLFGSNISPQRSAPIDSTVMATIAQYGLVFIVIVSILLWQAYKIVASNSINARMRFPAVSSFLFTLPIIGASNSFLVGFVMCSSVILLIYNAKVNEL